MKKTVLFLALCACLLSSCKTFTSDSISSGTQNSQTSTSQNPPVENKPIITGIEDITILQGSYFNPYNNVLGYASDGTDLTNQIQIAGYFDYAKVGTYELDYSLKDAQGNIFEKTRKIHVLKNDEIDKEITPYIYHSSKPYVISQNAKVVGNYRDNNNVSNLTDGDISTRYESNWEESTSEIVIDLGASLKVESYRILFENASALKYEILVSDDGETYRSAYKFDTKTGGARVDENNLDATGRYFKFLFIEKALTAYGYSVFEIELYGYDGLAVPIHDYPELYEAKIIEDEQYLLLNFSKNITFDQINLSTPDWVNPSKYHVYVTDSTNREILVKEVLNGSTDVRLSEAVTTNSLKIVFLARPFYSKFYAISNIDIRLNGNGISYSADFSASSEATGHEAINANWNYSTYWASKEDIENQTIVFDQIVTPGRIDMKWNANHGKIYDVEISSDGINFELFYRQIHGYSTVQSFYLNQPVKAIRFIDYANESKIRYQLEAVTVHSKYPNDPNITYEIPDYNKNIEVYKLSKGSYISNTNGLATARYVGYLSEGLMSKPIPSNGVWQSLLINNFGHAMYFNPLRTKFTSQGLDISLPGEGYFETTYNRSQVVTDFVDLTLLLETKQKNPETKVLDYSESSVTVGYSSLESEEFITTFASGSPYTYHTFLSSTISVKINNMLGIYDLAGKEINGEYIGDGVVIKLSRLEGYEQGVAIYEDRYYVLNAPNNTSFTLKKDVLTLEMKDEHYLSIGAFVSSKNAMQFHNHGYSFIYDTKTNFSYDESTNIVTTNFDYRTVSFNNKSVDTLICLLPHHHKKMISFDSVEDYQTIRGTMKTMVGNHFETKDKFYGITPQLGEPTNSQYSRDTQLEYLNTYKNKMSQSSNLSEDAYWQGKALHPLANAVLISDQIGAYELRDEFLKLVKNILVEWYTYTGEDDKFYFYFDKEWKTVYYRVSEFGANTAISDHHFTYGYYAFASAVVATYDHTFLSDYGDMSELLINDYLSVDENNSMTCVLRNYDAYAGHSWAGGYADNDGGNNQESAGEALNAYASAYLYAIASNNIAMRDTAIGCYVTELNAIKQYWFDYDNDIFTKYPYEGLGQVYGGSNFYGTFFNGDPTYIYGIQWLPGGEFLSGYAIGEKEQKRLKEIYDSYIEESLNWAGKYEEGYQHILWVILAMCDSDSALERLSTRGNEIINHDEMFLCYYLINAFASNGHKSTNYTVLNGTCATIYENDSEVFVTSFNPSNEAITLEIVDETNGQVIKSLIPAKTLVTFNIKDYNSNFEYYACENNLSINNASSVYNYDSFDLYSFRLVFDKEKTYKFEVSVINTTNENLNILILDKNKNVIGTLVVFADDNMTMQTELYDLTYKEEIYLQIPHGLVINSLHFVSA